MLVALATAKPLARGVVSHGAPQARSIHLPPLSRAIGRSGLISQFQTILHKAVLAVSQHVAAVAKAPILPNATRLAPRVSIGNTLSPVARHMLSRPLGGTPFMPRPIPVQRQMMQVGLGTARTFATTRPIFANLVENVPVAARSLLEADFDLKVASGYRLRVFKAKKENKNTTKSKAKARSPVLAAAAASDSTDKLDVEALAQYFKAAPEAAVVSFLDIPLAPTPTGRMPLAEHPFTGPPVAPLRALADTHSAHNKHAIRVASLFRRLDAANVWEKGAAMEAFGDRTGLCTVLRVKFSGWTEDMVRGVIGEGGKGWCTLIETHNEAPSPWADEYSLVDDRLSSGSLSPLPWADEPSPMREIDFAAVTSSFVMPSMDFSATFSSRASSVAPVASIPSTPFHSDSDKSFSSYASSEADHADVESLNDDSDSFGSVWASESVRSASPIHSTLSFSSDHWRRVSTVIGDF